MTTASAATPLPRMMGDVLFVQTVLGPFRSLTYLPFAKLSLHRRLVVIRPYHLDCDTPQVQVTSLRDPTLSPLCHCVRLECSRGTRPPYAMSEAGRGTVRTLRLAVCCRPVLDARRRAQIIGHQEL